MSNTIGLSFNVEVYDVKGQLVGHFESNQGLEVTIDASIYASGVYYAKVTSATGSETIRLIKR